MSAYDPKRTSAVSEKEGRLLQRPENSSLLVAIPAVVVMVVVARIIGVIAMMVVVMMIAVVAMMIAVPSCGWHGTAGCDCGNNS
jgi:hypothetical protein